MIGCLYELEHTFGPVVGWPDDLAALTAVVDELAGQDLDGLSAVVRADQVLALRRLLTAWTATGAKNPPPSTPATPAGAELDQQPGSTAAWLRHRLRQGPGVARGSVRTTRTLVNGPQAATAQTLDRRDDLPALLGSWQRHR